MADTGPPTCCSPLAEAGVWGASVAAAGAAGATGGSGGDSPGDGAVPPGVVVATSSVCFWIGSSRRWDGSAALAIEAGGGSTSGSGAGRTGVSATARPRSTATAESDRLGGVIPSETADKAASAGAMGFGVV
jgi:hypothetical protein